MLSAAEKQRYARHLLLAEVGIAGQERLCAASVQLPADMDARAASVARAYLERAGVAVAADRSEPIGAAAPNAMRGDRDAVQALAGSRALEPAAAALLGALYAVEQLKAELAIGSALQLPGELCLAASVEWQP